MDSFKLSKNKITALEITVKVGCGRMCDYCPQELYIESFKSKHPGETRMLSLEVLRDYIKNVPITTLIKWTGFTEPLEAKEFPEMVEFLCDKGFDQTISTTLCGNKDSINYFIENLSIFSAITLHLPDNQGLMKGKFNKDYALILEAFVANYSLETKRPEVDFFLIGDNWHESIKEIIESSLKIFGEERILKAKYLNTRASAINVNDFGLKISQRKTSKEKYYCSYKRLNQGVLLPNGNVSLCCQDYGLVHTIGSLKTSKLEDIYNSIENNSELKNAFENGEFEPCNKCEHYQSIDAPATTSRVN